MARPLTSGVVDRDQTRALEIIQAAIEDLGGRIEDTIMTRVYVADNRRDQGKRRRHPGDFFRDIRPATTIVQVSFIDTRILVEIEAEAVYGGASAATPA